MNAPRKTSKSATAAFRFPTDTVAFLRDLKANNNREWFTANKSRYEPMVRQPAQDFCELMTAALERLTGLPHSSKIFRVNRDIRFSKDKTPYKAHLHMLFQPQERADAPKWFFGLEPDRLVVGAGVFGFKKAAINAYRQRVASADGKALASKLDKMRRAGIRTREPELKRVPSGFPADLPEAQAELLRHKGLTAWVDIPGGPAAAAKPGIVTASLAEYKKLKPVFDWLNAPAGEAV